MDTLHWLPRQRRAFRETRQICRRTALGYEHDQVSRASESGTAGVRCARLSGMIRFTLAILRTVSGRQPGYWGAVRYRSGAIPLREEYGPLRPAAVFAHGAGCFAMLGVPSGRRVVVLRIHTG